MTSTKHKNGTERIAEGYQKIKRNFDLVIDIQGDEPLINAETVKRLALLKTTCVEDVATVVSRFETTEEVLNPNCVKVVITKNNRALYFSRATIPFARDAGLVTELTNKT